MKFAQYIQSEKCQINLPIAESHSPKKAYHIVRSKKPRAYVGEIDPWVQESILAWL